MIIIKIYEAEKHMGMFQYFLFCFVFWLLLYQLSNRNVPKSFIDIFNTEFI